MKWILLIVVLLVLAIGAVAAIGSRLPVKHHATRKARIRQPASAIYAVVSGPPDWRPDIKEFAALPDADGRKRWWERDSHGNKITYELVESSPARHVTRIADKNLPYGGGWTVEITPAGANECDVRVTEDGEVYNIIFRALSRYVFGYYGSIESYLRNLAAKFGERPAIDA